MYVLPNFPARIVFNTFLVAFRVLRISDQGAVSASNSVHENRTVVGRGGARISASRNLWTGSGLKVDSVVTDATWAHGCA